MIDIPSAKADILIVDDTTDNLRLLSRILARDYRVRPIADPTQVYPAVRFKPPDLILLDVMMPEMDGYQVAAQLKNDPMAAEVPIIFVSALHDVESKVRAFSAGGVDYIPKPFEEREVLARVELHLALRRLQQELRSANEELERQNQALRQKMLENEALQAQLREQAIRDPLTGAFNRRYLIATLTQELAQAQRTGAHLSLVMMDVDHFKKVNDTYGHLAGDAVLQALVKLVEKQIRQGDTLCRYGGEEFVVVMPNALQEAAYHRADAWRIAFEQQPILYEDQVIHVTLSGGVSSNRGLPLTYETIINNADQALYLAKEGGRNRIVSWLTAFSPLGD